MLTARTVGVAPGTYTLQLNGCPPDSPNHYAFSPFEPGPDMMTASVTGGDAYAYGSSYPYGSDAALKGVPPVALGVRLDIFGAILGTIVIGGIAVAALVGLTRSR